MTVSQTSKVTACIEYPNLFLHPLLDETQPANSQANRREQAMLRSQADKLCLGCPLLQKCLTDAVTKFDVSGFVAGTTRRQRQEIRSRLRIRLAVDDLDSYAGVTSGRQFDRNEIHRLRNANPDESLSSIASRIGCSVSTVKRHLRRIEREGLKTRRVSIQPSPAEIVAAAEQVKLGKRRSVAA